MFSFLPFLLPFHEYLLSPNLTESLYLSYLQMTWSLPSFPYPPAKDGYWEPVTSTLNWCEEVSHPAQGEANHSTNLYIQDYYATEYAAEIVNALTNLMFMWLGVQGILSCRRNGHDQIFTVALLGYLIVGTGSFFFHSTLKCKCFSISHTNTRPP
jgi:dihydroceramidase